MESNRPFNPSPHPMGIVVVFPPGVTSLFNPDVHRILREVENRLENVFVTYALSGGATPDIQGGIHAARFAGCSLGVVIHYDEWLGRDGWIEPRSDTLWTEQLSPIGTHEAARRVVSAYNQARAITGAAA